MYDTPLKRYLVYLKFMVLNNIFIFMNHFSKINIFVPLNIISMACLIM